MLEQIKNLRERTGVSVMACKKALEEAGGDMEKAISILRQEGIKIAEKKSERSLNAGIIESYIHSNKMIGVLLEARSETDFVARNEEFISFSHDIAMHIAASDPKDTAELLQQPYIKNPGVTVGDYLREMIQKFGENIEISRFVRYNVLD
ncbi:MAG: translation elongation factor Ts [Candidatus Terrybacteria bacterium]|nr:translation elongation factor Ts [Candidatus Terrybacteria bacterium]